MEFRKILERERQAHVQQIISVSKVGFKVKLKYRNFFNLKNFNKQIYIVRGGVIEGWESIYEYLLGDTGWIVCIWYPEHRGWTKAYEWKTWVVKCAEIWSNKAGMHNLFKIRAQKKKKDNVEGQSNAWMLKHVLDVKTLFFFYNNTHELHYCFILLMYRLSNE